MAKETDDVVDLLLALGEAAGRSLEDLDIGLSDAIYFFDALRKIGPAIEGASNIPHELENWTDADTAELVELSKHFDIPQDNLEAVVKDAIKLAGPLIEFISKFKRPAS